MSPNQIPIVRQPTNQFLNDFNGPKAAAKMAQQVEEEPDFEYVNREALAVGPKQLIPPSYESLPRTYSLLQNMMAGAFAGIAVSLSSKRDILHAQQEI
jgi:hypothetical protein